MKNIQVADVLRNLAKAVEIEEEVVQAVETVLKHRSRKASEIEIMTSQRDGYELFRIIFDKKHAGQINEERSVRFTWNPDYSKEGFGYSEIVKEIEDVLINLLENRPL